MSPGGLPAKAALQLLQQRLAEDPDCIDIASKAEAGRRSMGLTVDEMIECLLTLTPQQSENLMGLPAKNPKNKPGVHYEFHQHYDGKDIYIKFRISKDAPIEITSFDPDGSIR